MSGKGDSTRPCVDEDHRRAEHSRIFSWDCDECGCSVDRSTVSNTDGAFFAKRFCCKECGDKYVDQRRFCVPLSELIPDE